MYPDPIVRKRMSATDRFFHKLKGTKDGCIIFTGSRCRGYPHGAYRYEGKIWSAHVLCWVLEGKSQPQRFYQFLQNICGNPKCVNPSHLMMSDKIERLKQSNKGKL